MQLFGMVHMECSTQYTHAALVSFFAHTALGPRDRVIVYDNDHSFPQQWRIKFPRLEVVANPRPLGFAANVNQAICTADECSADLFFLNNDLVFTEGWLTPLLRDDLAILSPVSNGEVQYHCELAVLGSNLSLDHYLKHEALFELIIASHMKRSKQDLPRMVLPFFCVKLQKEVYRKLGLLDEAFGNGGGEDFDYCLRAQQADIPVRFVQSSYIVHFGGKSSWSLITDTEARRQHDATFINIFRDKWGSELTDIVFGSDFSPITANASLFEAMQLGRFQSVVSELMPTA